MRRRRRHLHHRIFHLYQRQHQKKDTPTQRKHLVDTVLTRGDTHKVNKQKPASNQKRANAWCDDYACAWTPTWPTNWWASVSLKSMKIFMVSWYGILVLVSNSMLWFLLYRIQNYGSMTLFVCCCCFHAYFSYLVRLGLTLAFPSALTLTFSRSRVTLANIVGKIKKKTSADKFRIRQTKFYL